jgi:hypothetical protein
MQFRPRVAIGVEPFMVRSAIHTVLSRDPRIESVLLPQEPDVRLQAHRVEVDALVVSHEVVRPDTLVIALSPAGTVEVTDGGEIRRVPYEGISALVDLVLDEPGRTAARRRHPAAPARTLAAT